MPVRPVVQNSATESALRAVLQRSLQRVLPGGKASAWSTVVVPDRQTLTEQEFVMLTISGYTFRVILLLHCMLNEPVRQIASEILKTPPEKLSPERMLDCLNEFGNTLCGDLKREFAQISPHLGMSTPNRLHHNNLAYIHELAVGGEAHVRVVHGSQHVLAASLYACTYGTVDFQALLRETAGEEQAASELELF